VLRKPSVQWQRHAKALPINKHPTNSVQSTGLIWNSSMLIKMLAISIIGEGPPTPLGISVSVYLARFSSAVLRLLLLFFFVVSVVAAATPRPCCQQHYPYWICLDLVHTRPVVIIIDSQIAVAVSRVRRRARDETDERDIFPGRENNIRSARIPTVQVEFGWPSPRPVSRRRPPPPIYATAPASYCYTRRSISNLGPPRRDEVEAFAKANNSTGH